MDKTHCISKLLAPEERKSIVLLSTIQKWKELRQRTLSGSGDDKYFLKYFKEYIMGEDEE